MDEQTTREMPEILVLLAELEGIAMQAARDPSRGLDCQLAAVCTAHRLLIDRLLAIETRDIPNHVTISFPPVGSEADL